jgi:hypothetical protein
MRLGTSSLATVSLATVEILGMFLLFGPISAQATNGRDFFGFYELTDATDLGPEVRVTLSLSLFNQSTQDVIGASIGVDDARQAGNGHQFPTASLRRHEELRLRDTFLISRQEYERWRRGGVPTLRITYTGSNGKPQRRAIDLAPQAPGSAFQL